jgi:hypothetical protein
MYFAVTVLPETVRLVHVGVHDCHGHDVPAPDTSELGVTAPAVIAEVVTLFAANAALPMVPPVTAMPYMLPLLLVVYPLNVSAEIVAFVIVGLFRVGDVNVLFVSV